MVVSAAHRCINMLCHNNTTLDTGNINPGYVDDLPPHLSRTLADGQSTRSYTGLSQLGAQQLASLSLSRPGTVHRTFLPFNTTDYHFIPEYAPLSFVKHSLALLCRIACGLYLHILSCVEHLPTLSKYCSVLHLFVLTLALIRLYSVVR